MLTWNDGKDLSETNIVRAASYEKISHGRNNEFQKYNFYFVDSFHTVEGTIEWNVHASFFTGDEKTRRKVRSLEEGKALCESWRREFWSELEQIVKQHQN